MGKPIIYIGLDLHKDTIAVAEAEAGKRGEVREHGKVANTSGAVRALAVKLARGGNALHFCYEAGPCGYGIQRELTVAGHDCVVVAPSLIPRKAGDRIKTDRRDAINLAKLHRAGELAAVWVPDQTHEAIRESCAGAAGGGSYIASSAPATVWLSAVPRPPLSPASLDTDAPALASEPQVRTTGALHRAGGSYRGSRGRNSAPRPFGSPYRGDTPGLVPRIGCPRPASTSRRRDGVGGDIGGRTRRHHPLHQSSPGHGLSRLGTIRTLQRQNTSARWNHQSW